MGWLGSVELGGTNCRVAIGDESSAIIDEDCFETGDDPALTMRRVAQWFGSRPEQLEVVGVASFGPLDVSSASIAATPKSPWRDIPLRHRLAELAVPIVVDTDVNAAVLAEWTSGAGLGFEDVLYMTVGTGIGVGAIVGGRRRHATLHPEMGHMRIPRHPEDRWPGSCPFHGDCWEGLASGHALAERYRVPPETLADTSAWRIETAYIALGVANLICSYRPQRVVIGGGVLGHEGLIETVRVAAAELLNVEYFPEAANIGLYLVPPSHGHRSGLIGAWLLAREWLVASDKNALASG